MTPAAHLHVLAGAPAVDGCEDAPLVCWLCASHAERGMLSSKWQGANFTDQNKARAPHSAHVCEPCIWACSWVPPPGFPPPPPGKKGLNLRLFSHLLDGRGYLAVNKASKPEIRGWLRGSKTGAWFAAISDTGQKHLLPWTPVNPAGAVRGVVRFEERNVALPEECGWILVDDMTRLLSTGSTKDEIVRGEYSARSWQRCGADVISAFEAQWSRQRGGGWWALAIWLAQKEEGDADRDAARGAEAKDGGVRDGGASGVPRRGRKPAQALGPDPRPDAKRGADKRRGRGVGDGDAAKPSAHRGQQGNLFDDVGAD